MEKNFTILNSSIILEYDQSIERHDVEGSSSDLEARPSSSAASDGFSSSLQDDRRVDQKADFYIESLGNCNYDEVEGCPISEANNLNSVSITDSSTSSSGESRIMSSNSNQHQEILLSQTLELQKNNCLVIGNREQEGMKSSVISKEVKNKDDVDLMGKSDNAKPTVPNLVNEDSASKMDTHSVVIASSVDERGVAVDSNLQFLGSGNSIVVLAQDPGSLGLTNIVSEMAIPCDKEMGIERYEFSTVADDQGNITTNSSDNQPTFFQVELYSTSPLQANSCQEPATVISAQQVLTVPQLFSCHWEGCNTHFLSKDDLVLHVTGQHAKPTQAQQYKCLWSGCSRNGKSFDARYKILTHLRSHTGERPHMCSVEGCHKSFARLDNLKIHARSHTGERPYACPYDGCTKRYANSSDRFKHTRTHLERKPYKCRYEGCEKSYTDPSSLRKHHHRHQKEEDKRILAESEPVVILPDIENE